MNEESSNLSLPKEKRGMYLACAGTSLAGAAVLVPAFEVWSRSLAVVGFLLMADGLIGIRLFVWRRRRWFDDALWGILSIAPLYQIDKLLRGPKVLPNAGMVGAGTLLVWTLFAVVATWSLWRMGESVTSTDSSVPIR